MDATDATVAQLGNNNQAHQYQDNEFILAAFSSTINLPRFWLDKPHTWFNMFESAFTACQITSPITKYNHCMGKLGDGGFS